MAKNNIQLSDHFHYRRLLRFTMPAILMLIFTSVYSIVDALCRRQFYYAPFNDSGVRRLHVRNGRRRADCQDNGRR